MIVKTRTVYFVGISGQSYPFTLYPLNADLPDTAAVYIFTRAKSGSYQPLYIGQTDTGISKNYNHKVGVCIRKFLVNSICVCFEGDETTRIKIERDLIDLQRPPCNNIQDQND